MSTSEPSFPLNADLTDRLLSALPEFQSLQAFILSSKFVYSVFRRRQNSILSAVAQSQFGSALPQAMRLVEFLDGDHSSGLVHDVRSELGAQDFSITPRRICVLRDHAAIVGTLEDIYSWQEKDPRSRNSRLSVAESVRFQQSVYRFWLLAAACGPRALADRRLESGDSKFTDSIVAKQTAFLSSLRKTELMGVDEVHRFLLDLAKWALLKRTTSPKRTHLGFGESNNIHLVWSGPAVTLDAFRGKWPSFSTIDSHWYGTRRAMTHTFVAIEIASMADGTEMPNIRQHAILDNHFLKTVDCHQCQGLLPSFSGGSLWSLCNWEYMILDVPPSRLASMLSFEKRRPLELLVSFTKAIESTPYSQLIEEIFNIRSARYRNWKKDDWLCTRCMIRLLSDNIHAWFDEKNC